ncbi:TRAP transporter substrate-binding protein DctP [Cupriavidus sp. BIC8F]|uniref:TRAP transporter substrate-binding protein DctP n=1 Tax=Cupriavidus sp. BIC8F TaxID=3079014 RepID=UPI002915D6A3|nr:TRAP transporter substrate-binding protein DctP [Cupriavidus sp. BIC8F]
MKPGYLKLRRIALYLTMSIGLTCTDGSAAEVVGHVTMVQDMPSGHPREPYVTATARAISGATGGEMQVDVNPGGKILAGKASLDAVRSGQVNIAWVNASHLEAIDPRAGFINLPFGIDDKSMAKTETRRAVVDLLQSYMSGQRLIVLGLMRGADQLFVLPNKDVRAVADVVGLRVRVAGPGIYEEVMRSLDADPVVIPIPEIGRALEAGKLDAVFTSPGGWASAVGKRASHAALVPGLMFITYAVVANADWFAGLSPAQQRRIRDAVQLEVTDRWADMLVDDEKVMKSHAKAGANIWIASPAESLEWRSRLVPVSNRFWERFPETQAAFRQLPK